jgi:glycosyltransferase involved in cell wall biosynthesis
LAKNSKNILTIAISTIFDNRERLINYLFGISDRVPSSIIFLVISQLEKNNYREHVSENIKLITSTDKGLSKSRNIAIDDCSTEWIWFQDDDIELLTDSLQKLVKFLSGYSGDFVLGKVLSSENEDNFFKDYSRYYVRSDFLAFRVSSIEMISKVEFLRPKKIRFDENLGLGAYLPSCEENLFFYDSIRRNHGKYTILDFPVCCHTTNIDTRKINQAGRYKARGYLLAKIRSHVSPFILIWWSVRPALDGVPRLVRLCLMLSGVAIVVRNYFRR